MSSIDKRVSKALLTSREDTFWRYLKPLCEFYRLADQVNIRSNSFVPMSDGQMAETLTQMLTQLGRAELELSLRKDTYRDRFRRWRTPLYGALTYERNGLEQHEVKVALKKLSRRASKFSSVIEREVGRNAWVRELEDIETLTEDTYGNPDLSADESLRIYNHIVGLVEECEEILEEAGSSIAVIAPLKAKFTSVFTEEYGKNPLAVG